MRCTENYGGDEWMNRMEYEDYRKQITEQLKDGNCIPLEEVSAAHPAVARIENRYEER